MKTEGGKDELRKGKKEEIGKKHETENFKGKSSL